MPRLVWSSRYCDANSVAVAFSISNCGAITFANTKTKSITITYCDSEAKPFAVTITNSSSVTNAEAIADSDTDSKTVTVSDCDSEAKSFAVTNAEANCNSEAANFPELPINPRV